MNILKCVRGHFYDGDRFDSCPHCEKESAQASSGTAPQVAANVIGSTVMNADFHGFGGEAGDEDQEGTVVITPEAMREEDEGTLLLTMDMEQKAAQAMGQGQNVMPKPGVAMGRVPGLYTTPEHGAAMGRVPGQNVVPQAQAAGEKAAADRVQEDELTVRFSPVAPESDPMVGLLICIKGRDAGRHYTIRSGMNGIGRSEPEEIRVTSGQGILTQNYAYLCYDPGSRRFWLQPGELQGYTYLNEYPLLESKWLNHHDRLKVGDELLLFIPICGPEFAWEDLN